MVASIKYLYPTYLIFPLLLLTLMVFFGLGFGSLGMMGGMGHPGYGGYGYHGGGYGGPGMGGFSGVAGGGLLGMLGGVALGLLVFAVVSLFLFPYCVGGLMGTVADAVRPGANFSAWNFFGNGVKYYWRTFVFFLLGVVLGLVLIALGLIGGLIFHYIWSPLIYIWILALFLASACLYFYWLPALYLEDGGQFVVLGDALRVTFTEGKWRQAIGFIAVCFLAWLVIFVVAMIFNITVIGIIIGVPLSIVGPIFLEAFYLLGVFNAYNGGLPGPTEAVLVPASEG